MATLFHRLQMELAPSDYQMRMKASPPDAAREHIHDLAAGLSSRLRWDYRIVSASTEGVVYSPAKSFVRVLAAATQLQIFRS
jgi:hypothetical protein